MIMTVGFMPIITDGSGADDACKKGDDGSEDFDYGADGTVEGNT